MLPRVLLVDNHDSFTYNLVQLLHESRLCRYKVVLNDRLGETDPADFDKILISPGPGTPADIPQVAAMILQQAGKKSILGICLGLQAVAVAFGGSLVNLEEVRHGIRTQISLTDPVDPLFEGMGSHPEVGLYHSWSVDVASLPGSLRVTAVDSEQVIMGISHRTLDVKGVQFHPESYMTLSGMQIVRNWLSR